MRLLIKEYYSIKEERIKGGQMDVDVTSLVLSEGGEYTRKVHCMYCGVPLFQFTGRLIKSIPGSVPSTVPVLIRCPRSDCGHNYLIEKILEREI